MSFRRILALVAVLGQVYCFDESEEFRIISGRKTSTLEFPYSAEIKKKGIHWCGGSIIHEYFILSAAHCFLKGSAIERTRLFRVLVGNDERLTGGKEYRLQSIIIHEKYNIRAAMDQFDISLVKLSRPISFSETVMLVRLAESTPGPGQMGWVIGFGRTDPTKPNTDTRLRAVELPVVDLAACRRVIDKVADDMICAGGKEGTGDACLGDSGGPYVVGDFQVGIVAWGQDCGLKGFPGVYTNVAHYKNWIETKIKQYSSSKSKLMQYLNVFNA